MTQAVAVDLLGSRGYRNLTANLTGPLAAGSVLTPIPIAADGTIEVQWTTRAPLLVLGPKSDLGVLALAVTGQLDGIVTALPALTFAAYTQVGAALPLHVPATGEDDRAAAFKLAIKAVLITDDAETPVPPGDLAGLFEVTLIEGQMGKLIYLLTAEKNRLRRIGAEVAAMRRLGLAHRDALDRYGADLGVPRRADLIGWDQDSKEILSRIVLGPDGEPSGEPDRDYRRRLSLYRPFALPTRGRLETLLNGPPDAAAPAANRGLMSELGLAARFQLRESENRFAVAVHLFGGGADQARLNFLDHLRQVRLIWPRSDPPANVVHADRVLPLTTRQEIQALRSQLRDTFDWPPSAAIAPALATALARAGRVVRALGSDAVWSVIRAQDPEGGSRYELGLGVDITPPTNAQITALQTALADAGRAASDDVEAEGLIAAMRAAGAGAAEDLARLWSAAGLQTVHRVDGARLYLSHLPTRGLVVNGPSTAAVGQTVQLEAHYHAAGDPGVNAALLEAIRRADAEWQASGHPQLDRIADDAAPALWQQAAPLPAGHPAGLVLPAAGLPVISDPGPVVAALKAMAGELLDTVRLPADLAAKIIANTIDAAPLLAEFTDVLRRSGVASALPLVLNSGEVILVLSAVGLPQTGINLNQKRITGFRWYAVPLGGEGQVQALGSRVDLMVQRPGLIALVTLGYVRTDQSDPYEIQVDLPEGAVLDLVQYEFLMNLLERSYPVGVEINTYSIRKGHVDVDGDGVAEPLRGSAASTYRRFVDRRGRGRYRASTPTD